MSARKPKRGQQWKRKRTGDYVTILAVVNPMGDARPCVVIEALRVTTVRLDLFHRSYEGPL